MSYLNIARHRTRLSQLLLFVLFVAGIGFIAARPASAVQSDPDVHSQSTVALPDEALQAPSFLASYASTVTRHPKMDTSLAQAAESWNASPQAAASAMLDSGLRLDKNRVQVTIAATNSEIDKAADEIESAGGVVTFRSDIEPVVQAWVPVSALEDLSESPSIAYISAPSYAVELEDEAVNAQTEGLIALNGTAWHNAGYNGSGVKIAIIDGSFAGYQLLLGSDLPASVTVQNFVDGEDNGDVGTGSSKHGTACAEIAADIVPGASFYLIKISTNLDLEQAVNYAISQGVDVISTSVGWYNLTPGDGSGFFDNLVKKAGDNGIIWLTAAGNDRENHWGGQFYDPDNDGFHNFSGVQEINFFGPGNNIPSPIDPGMVLSVFVRWDDWSVTNQDYVLYVLRWNGSAWDVVGSSDRPQAGAFGQTPTESVVGLTFGSPAPYGFIIQRKSSNRNVNLEIFAPKMPRLDELVVDRSLPNLADAAHVETLGALGSLWPYGLEEFSAQGPTNGPGGTLAGGAIKPDFAGYSGVSTASYGFRNFSGTSAAAPHGAGAAALVKDAFPSYSAQDIADFLAQRAEDKGAPGKDNVYGYGRLYLGDPPGMPPVLPFNNFLPVIIK